MIEVSPFFAIGVVIVVYAVAIVWVIARLRRKRAELAARESSFVDALIASMENDSVSSLEHLHDLYRAHFDENLSGLVQVENVSRLLRQAIHIQRIATSHPANLHHPLLSKLPALRTLLSSNEERVRQEQLRLPFSDAPAPERQLLEDILELTTSDKEVVRTKLSELGKAVRIRQDTIDRLGKESHQSLVWAKWGLVGTVVFSLIHRSCNRGVEVTRCLRYEVSYEV